MELVIERKRRAVTDPRDGRRVALKKLPNVFQSLVSSKRVFRELKMLCFFKHENVLSALDILQPPHLDFFQEIDGQESAHASGTNEETQKSPSASRYGGRRELL
ncbi:Serine/threonine-protein kinase NLK [Vespula maculifrons]|uniref:Uncharacterized protein n=2 Tax=Vespula TaxID=7451 RepID=A0A834JGR0_VESVU|nr:hypothetical protein HZH66_010795 [Vespula vulgaris]